VASVAVQVAENEQPAHEPSLPLARPRSAISRPSNVLGLLTDAERAAFGGIHVGQLGNSTTTLGSTRTKVRMSSTSPSRSTPTNCSSTSSVGGEIKLPRSSVGWALKQDGRRCAASPGTNS
jgi:hypothetical protein